MKNLSFFCSVKSHYNNVALLLFRVLVSGALIYGHGYGKFIRLLDGNVWGRTHLFFSEEVTFAMITFAEFFCSIFIILNKLQNLSCKKVKKSFLPSISVKKVGFFSIQKFLIFLVTQIY